MPLLPLRWLGAAIAAFVLLAASAVPADARRGTVPPAQELALLTSPHAFTSSLGENHGRTGTVAASGPITRVQTVLPVVGHGTTEAGAEMLHVMLPGRPNSSEGWIEQKGTDEAETPWRIIVSTSARRVYVYRGGRRVRSFSAVVGKHATPTPHGTFFVEESISMRGSVGGPYALALSARSNVLHQFGAGPGQIGIHGLQNLGGKLGSAESHGCVRVANRSISWITARVAPGAPVTIRG
jgi:lipoprotein-anchoring transpeptidase ErfK/SrfK